MQVWDILHLYARTHNQFQNTDRMWPSVCIHLTPLPKNSHWEAFCYIFCHLFSYIKAKKKKNETSMTRLKIFMSYHSWWLNYLLGCCGVTVCVCVGGGREKSNQWSWDWQWVWHVAGNWIAYMVLVGRNKNERDCFEDLGVGGKIVLMLKERDDRGWGWVCRWVGR